MRGRRREGREETTRRVFSYAATLIEPVSPKVLEAGREMQRLWSICVIEHDAVCAEARDKSKEEKREIFKTLYSRIYPQLAASWLPSTFYLPSARMRLLRAVEHPARLTKVRLDQN